MAVFFLSFRFQLNFLLRKEFSNYPHEDRSLLVSSFSAICLSPSWCLMQLANWEGCYFLYSRQAGFSPCPWYTTVPLVRGQRTITSGRRKTYCGSSCQEDRRYTAIPLLPQWITGRKKEMRVERRGQTSRQRCLRILGSMAQFQRIAWEDGILLIEIPHFTWQ